MTTTTQPDTGPPPAEPARSIRRGWVIIARKEFTDSLLSLRFTILMVLVGLTAVGVVQAATSSLRDAAPAASDAPAVLLRMLTVAPQDLPSFFSFFGLVGFLAPLLAIAFGFDAVNGERSQGTLARLVSQPIHRDDVINGKFVAGLALIGSTLGLLTAIVVGLGIFRLGITPAPSEVLRLLTYLAVAVVYAGVWLAVAILASVVVRRTSTSALIAIAAWIVITIFWALLASLAADIIAPAEDDAPIEAALDNARTQQTIERVSPETLYEEASTALLLPEVRSLDVLTVEQLDRAVSSELDYLQSLLVVWPQTTALVALTVVLFTAAYVAFMRQEIRA